MAVAADRRRVYAALQGLISSGTTIILVEQDLNRALAVSDRVICMLEGRVALEGSTRDISREDVTKAYFGLHRKSPGSVPA